MDSTLLLNLQIKNATEKVRQLQSARFEEDNPIRTLILRMLKSKVWKYL